MNSTRVSGTEGYAEQAEELLKRWEKIFFADSHRPVLHLIPKVASSVLDIGSGAGGDAAAFAAMGHHVVAVEPTAELRLAAIVRHPSPRIEWLDDSLPELNLLARQNKTFDLVMLSAVWMHLDEAQRRHAMAKLASLMRAGAVMIMSLRHGPVPRGRRMFEVSAEETIGLARAPGLRPVLNLRTPSIQETNRRAGVVWTRLAFVKSKRRA